jgi:hypothetical protein
MAVYRDVRKGRQVPPPIHHRRGYLLALAASHSFCVISTKPLPLQEFWPLHELLADLQEDCPLQELTPVQCTFASSADALVIEATLNSMAAALAIAAPEIDFDIIMIISLE